MVASLLEAPLSHPLLALPQPCPKMMLPSLKWTQRLIRQQGMHQGHLRQRWVGQREQQSRKAPQSSLSLVRAMLPHIAGGFSSISAQGVSAVSPFSNAQCCGFSHERPQLATQSCCQAVHCSSSGLLPTIALHQTRSACQEGVRKTTTGITLLDATRALSAMKARP